MSEVLDLCKFPDHTVAASRVHEVLKRATIGDGLDLVVDLQASQGSWLVDERDSTNYLDMFTFFASSALGMNHPALREDDQFRAELLTAALNKPSNSDVYSVPMAQFVDTFQRVLGDANLPHLFFIEGGALAVENALKIAFDWKSRWNESHGIDPDRGTKVLHLQHAFHGRSGYTLSLTNTGPEKVARFPKFDWPRIPAPVMSDTADVAALERDALDAARRAFVDNPHDIACFLMEPIQGEGGDNHFRPEFLHRMHSLAHEFDALFVLDEVQTGCGFTGSAWAYQQLGVKPDVVAFGKKLQVCGVMAGGRVDEVPDNVFAVSSRINSTWGGNLTDMVRSRRILEVIERDDLIGQAHRLGAHLHSSLVDLAIRHSVISNVRGRGLMRAFTLPDTDLRDRVLSTLFAKERVILLGSGTNSIRFRPALTVSTAELDQAVTAVDRVLVEVASDR